MSTVRNLSLRWKLVGGFGLVVGVMVALIAAALVMQGRLATATDHITQTATPKSMAGQDAKYGAADLVGWQQAYVLDRGDSRPSFLHAAAMYRKRLARLHDVSVDPKDFADVRAGDRPGRRRDRAGRRRGRLGR